MLLTHLTLQKWRNSAPVQLAQASRVIMHDIGSVETIFMIFRLWTVSSYSYIKLLPTVSSCSPDALNVFKMARFCSSSIDLCQQCYHARYWVCRDYIYDFPTLNSFLFLFVGGYTVTQENLKCLEQRRWLSDIVSKWNYLPRNKKCLIPFHMCW